MSKDFEIGQDVYYITSGFCPEEEKIIHKIVKSQVIIVDEEKEKITLNDNIYKKHSKDKLFLKENTAKVALQDFINSLKFDLGDFVVITDSNEKRLGRVKSIDYGERPYNVEYINPWSNYCSSNYFFEKQLLKIKNSYIEDYEDCKDLVKELSDLEKQYKDKLNTLYKIYNKLGKKFLKEAKLKNSNHFFSWFKKSKDFGILFEEHDDEY